VFFDFKFVALLKKTNLRFMEIFNKTGVITTGSIRVIRPVESLSIHSTKSFSDLSEEKINVYIESNSGNNTFIIPNLPLKSVVLASTFGESAINSQNGFNAVIELGLEGAVYLDDGETMKVELTGLDSEATYIIDAIEAPEISTEIVDFEEKTILSEQTLRTIDVSDAAIMVLAGFDTITNATFKFINGKSVKYSSRELKTQSFDIDPLLGIVGTGVTKTVLGREDDFLVFPVDVVDSIDFEKKPTGVCVVTLRNSDI